MAVRIAHDRKAHNRLDRSSAFVVGWPVAAVTAFVAIPLVRQLTQVVVAIIDCAI